MQTFGEKVAKVIEKRGMTIRQLSIHAGIPYSTVYGIVKNGSQRVCEDTKRKIATALDFSLNELETSNSFKLTPADIALIDAVEESYFELTLEEREKIKQLLAVMIRDSAPFYKKLVRAVERGELNKIC